MYDGQATGEAFPYDLYPPGHQKGKGLGNPTKNGKQPIPAVAFYVDVELFKVGEHGLRGFRTKVVKQNILVIGRIKSKNKVFPRGPKIIMPQITEEFICFLPQFFVGNWLLTILWKLQVP